MVSDGREGAREGRGRTVNTIGFAIPVALRVFVGKKGLSVPGSDTWGTGSASPKDGRR